MTLAQDTPTLLLDEPMTHQVAYDESSWRVAPTAAYVRDEG